MIEGDPGAPGGLSVVIPTHSTRELTLRCIESIHAHGGEGDEVIVVDDASEDDTVPEIRRRFPRVAVLELEARSGFTAAANRGMSEARGELLLLLNSDTEILPGSLDALRRAFRSDSSLGIAGGRLFYPDGEPQWSGGDEPGLAWGFALASGLGTLAARLPAYRRLRPVRGSREDRRPVQWVTGAALACRRSVWREVGHLDPAYRFYCQDLDFCARARRAGWAVAIVPDFRVIHVHGATVTQGAGTVGQQSPELLWSDLVRWAWKFRGPRSARRLRAALRAGAQVRVGCGRFRMSLASEEIRSRLVREATVYRRAIGALHEIECC